MHDGLNKQQQALASLMSDISEDGWAAGWMDGLEYVLWRIVLEGPCQYGFTQVNEQRIQQLKQLSAQAGCWIIFDDVTEETAVTLAEWQKMYQSAAPDNFRFYNAELDIE